MKGWKLHLNVADSNTDLIAKWLASNNVLHKVGRSSDQVGKSMTVYLGDKKAAILLVTELNAKFSCILPAIGDVLVDDICIKGNVWGRFDACHKDWHQYGSKGIPYLMEDMVLLKWAVDKPSIELVLDRSHKKLCDVFGEFYTG